jgi:hypothetical protein
MRPANAGALECNAVLSSGRVRSPSGPSIQLTEHKAIASGDYDPNLLMLNCMRCTCSESQLMSNKKRVINIAAVPKPAKSTLRSLL